MEDSDSLFEPRSEERIINEEREKDNFIYSIREELMAKVMLEVDKIDNKKRTIEFLVDIGCEALWRMLNIVFFPHNTEAVPNSPFWAGDSCMAPSLKDTMASNSVPIVPKTQKEEGVKERQEKFVCECHLGVPCECNLPQHKRDKVQMRLLEAILESSSETDELDEEEEEEPLVTEEESTETDEYSPQQTLTDISAQSLPVSELSSFQDPVELKCVLSEGFSKLTERKKTVVLPKVNVTKVSRSISVLQPVHLPAIRTAIKNDYRTIDNSKKKK